MTKILFIFVHGNNATSQDWIIMIEVMRKYFGDNVSYYSYKGSKMSNDIVETGERFVAELMSYLDSNMVISIF